MVICIVALVVFSFLSIFSAKYRKPAKEAFRCVFRMVQLKPCDVELEAKIKAAVTANLMPFPPLARFFYKHFKIISWIFTIIFFASLLYSLYGIYNIVTYGSCDPSNPATCLITSQSAQSQVLSFISCNELSIVIAILIILISILILYLIYLRKKNGND